MTSAARRGLGEARRIGRRQALPNRQSHAREHGILAVSTERGRGAQEGRCPAIAGDQRLRNGALNRLRRQRQPAKVRLLNAVSLRFSVGIGHNEREAIG